MPEVSKREGLEVLTVKRRSDRNSKTSNKILVSQRRASEVRNYLNLAEGRLGCWIHVL